MMYLFSFLCGVAVVLIVEIVLLIAFVDWLRDRGEEE